MLEYSPKHWEPERNVSCRCEEDGGGILFASIGVAAIAGLLLYNRFFGCREEKAAGS